MLRDDAPVVAAAPAPVPAAEPAAPAAAAPEPAAPAAAAEPAAVDLKAPKEPTLLAEEPKPEDKKDEPAAVVVPETYEFKVPEGQTEIDPSLVEAATPIFKELGLGQEQAQKLVDLYAGQMLPNVAQTIQSQTLELLGLGEIGKWTEQTKTDKEIGGAKLPETLVHAAAARDKFATPELRALLETSRIGNHPEVVRLFARIGKAVGEGTTFAGDASGAAVVDAGTKFYGEKYGPRT